MTAHNVGRSKRHPRRGTKERAVAAALGIPAEQLREHILRFRGDGMSYLAIAERIQQAGEHTDRSWVCRFLNRGGADAGPTSPPPPSGERAA